MKLDTVDVAIQKPDTKEDQVLYDKPNTYEEEGGSLPAEVLEDLIVRSEFIDGKRPDIKTNEEDELSTITSLLSLQSNEHPSPSPTTSSSNILLTRLKKRPMEDLMRYDLRKICLSRPEEHDILFYGTQVKAYKKIQPHSYSWGFQNILYRMVDGCEKVAEARRRALRKEITIEWGDQEDTKSNQLHSKQRSHLLFTYETEFEGYRLKWKKNSIRSHDLICEIKGENEPWRVISEFDSHRLGYFTYLGVLIIDKNALQLMDRPDHFEAHLIVTCCTLIDLMREVVEQAVGISKGGIVTSE